MSTTRLCPSGVSGQPYGSFAGRTTPSRYTRLSPSATPSRLYGDFGGKPEADAPAPLLLRLLSAQLFVGPPEGL